MPFSFKLQNISSKLHHKKAAVSIFTSTLKIQHLHTFLSMKCRTFNKRKFKKSKNSTIGHVKSHRFVTLRWLRRITLRHYSPGFKRYSSYIWPLCCRNQCSPGLYIHSRHCETICTLRHPWTHRNFYTGGLTCSHWSRPPCTEALSHWRAPRGDFVRAGTHFAEIGPGFPRRRSSSHDRWAPLRQGMRQCSSAGEFPLPSERGREKGWVHGAPPRYSWTWVACRCNFWDCTFPHSHSIRPTEFPSKACIPCNRNSSHLQDGTDTVPEWGTCLHHSHTEPCCMHGCRWSNWGVLQQLRILQRNRIASSFSGGAISAWDCQAAPFAVPGRLVLSGVFVCVLVKKSVQQ